LGYTPAVSLREGLTKIIDWYRAYAELPYHASQKS
jgi:nucleoside-diphosphate-sugar epimerase